MLVYNDKLDADTQITAEEKIASVIFNHPFEQGMSLEEESANLGRKILKMILEEFRPDLMEPF